MNALNDSPPPYFHKDGADAFKTMEVLDDDVVMVSFGKCGTTWMHNILFCLLRMDDQGNFPAALDAPSMVGSAGQIYPDGVPLKPLAKPDGPWTATGFSGLIAQAKPRLFTCHIRADSLPKQLQSRGRIVMVTRNPKDALVSGFYFFQKVLPKQHPARLEMEKGGLESYFPVFNQTSRGGEYGYGDYYTWHRDMLAYVEASGSRAILSLYETLQTGFRDEVERLAAFLKIPLSDAKFSALARRVSFDEMKERKVVTIRKGVVGDYEQHLTPSHWAEMDAMFRDRLGDIAALSPMHPYVGMTKGSPMAKL